MHKDSMKFHVIATDPVKNTVTLRPTIGTIFKINIAAAAVVYMAVRFTESRFDDWIAASRNPETPLEN